MEICKRCGGEIIIEEHHIHPRFMDNPKGLGLKVKLCKKCHVILHLIIPAIIWKYIKKEDKEKVINEVKNFTTYYSKLKNDIDKKLTDIEIKKNKCGNENCDREIDEEDILNRWCPFCNNSIKNKGEQDEHN